MAPCHFGLESVLKKEITDLGYDVSKVEDGRVTFIGDDEAVCRANIGLRTAERIKKRITQTLVILTSKPSLERPLLRLQ